MTLRAILAVLVLLIPAAAQAAATTPGYLVTKRAVLVMHHGIRAPLDGEVPEGTRTDRPWPIWPVAQNVVTPYGERALDIFAETDRRLLASRGLLDAAGCPKAGSVSFVANTSPRAIASAAAYLRGFAPQCDLKCSHLEEPQADPIFEPLRPKSTAFDADAAVADINRSTGGMARLATRDRKELALLNGVLGCGKDDCIPPRPPWWRATTILRFPARSAAPPASRKYCCCNIWKGCPPSSPWTVASEARLRPTVPGLSPLFSQSFRDTSRSVRQTTLS